MSHPIRWLPRETPLPPVALVAFAQSARLLATKIAALPDDELARLRGVSFGAGLALQVESGALPWVDGVHYLGRDTSAPRLLLPTNLTTDIPLDAFELAFFPTRFGDDEKLWAAPMALVPSLGRAVSLASARPISRELLEKWLAERQTPLAQ